MGCVYGCCFYYGQSTPLAYARVPDKVAKMLPTLFALPLAPAPDPYDYSYDTTMDSAAFAAFFMALMGIYALIFVVAWLVTGFAWAGVFNKAGYAKWKAFVPFYNSWIMVKMVGRPESHFWFLFIPYFNIYMMIVIMNDMSKSFGKDTGFTVGLVLLPVVFAAILSYGDAAYRGPSYLSADQKQQAMYYGQQQFAQQQYAAAPGQQYPNAQYPNAQYPPAQFGQQQYPNPQDPNAQYPAAPYPAAPYGQPAGPNQQDPAQNPFGSGPAQQP